MSDLDPKPKALTQILIAEDSATQAQKLEYVLSCNGYSAVRAADGRQALQMARANPPALVISDILMPEMDGYQLCRHIKSDPKLNHLPVILLTTLADAQDVIRGLECGADSFIIKPYDDQYLLSRVKFTLQNLRVRQQDHSDQGVEIFYNDQRHFITANRLQILNLLLSTYDAAIQRNQELTRIKDQLRTANQSLGSANSELQQLVSSERQMHNQLKAAQSQLVQAEKLAGLGQMVAGVAHEINNPLSFAANNIWVLKRDLTDVSKILNLYRQNDDLIAAHNPEAGLHLRELAQQIDLDYTLSHVDESLAASHEGLKRIEQIVKDLRDFARLDRGELQEVDINSGIQSTVNIISAKATEKNVALNLHLEELPLIACHPAKLNQVVMNLVSNAIDACQDGGQVTISTRSADNQILVEVTDTGSGIDPAIKDRIFDPFFTTKPLGKGTGLGLSISYGIIQALHGTIEVDSQPANGTRFTIQLPLSPVREPSLV